MFNRFINKIIYSITFNKMKLKPHFYHVAICLFEEKDEWEKAAEFELTFGNKLVKIKAEINLTILLNSINFNSFDKNPVELEV